MKPKLLILISFFIFYNFSLQAQFQIGLRAGINSSTVKLKNVSNTNPAIEYNRGDFGYHFGIVSQFKFSKIFIQPELLYTISKLDIAIVQGGPKQLGRQTFNSIDLPIMAGVKLRSFKLEVGPVATVMLSSKSALLDQNNIKPSLSGATIGYQAGVGVELGSLLIDVKYEGNLSKFGNGININNTQVNFDQRMSAIIVSLGYFFY